MRNHVLPLLYVCLSCSSSWQRAVVACLSAELEETLARLSD